MEANLRHVVDPIEMEGSEETSSMERSLLRMAHLGEGSGPLVPLCVCSTTGQASHHLTTKEISNALDLPATFVQGLPAAEVKSLLCPGLVRSKIRLQVAEAILEFINPTSESESQKRSTQFALGNIVEKRP